MHRQLVNADGEYAGDSRMDDHVVFRTPSHRPSHSSGISLAMPYKLQHFTPYRLAGLIPQPSATARDICRFPSGNLLGRQPDVVFLGRVH